MQVYANSFRVDGPDSFRAVAGAIHGWLKKVLDLSLSLQDITREGEFSNKKLDTRPWLRVFVASGGNPTLYAWRLKHLDSEVSGRQWVIEIGIKQGDNFLDFSCSVVAEEQSTLVRQGVSASRPRLIGYILRNIREASTARISSEVPGIQLKHIGRDASDYRALRVEIERDERDYPIVLVSPIRDGTYLVSPTHLQEALFGLAQVVAVDPVFDSYEMEEGLGRSWSAWDGAVNLIQVRRSNGQLHSSLLRANEIGSAGDRQLDRVGHILALVTHNTNVPRLRSRIRPDAVIQLSLRRRLEARRSAVSSDPAAIKQENDTLWQEVEVLEQNIRQLQQELDSSELSRLELEEQLQDTERALRTEQYKATLTGKAASVSDINAETRLLLELAARADQPSPSDCLAAIEKVFPNTCEVLDSAWRSAWNMPHFQNGRRLLDMLRRLMTDYVDAMQAGGDSHAKQVFTSDEYSATESGTVMNSKPLKSKRCFVRDGVEIAMFRHLKIGKSDNVALTLRLHFEWLAEEKKIVIGHCGEHLPISSH